MANQAALIHYLPIGHPIDDKWVKGLQEQEDQRESEVCRRMMGER